MGELIPFDKVGENAKPKMTKKGKPRHQTTWAQNVATQERACACCHTAFAQKDVIVETLEGDFHPICLFQELVDLMSAFKLKKPSARILTSDDPEKIVNSLIEHLEMLAGEAGSSPEEDVMFIFVPVLLIWRIYFSPLQVSRSSMADLMVIQNQRTTNSP